MTARTRLNQAPSGIFSSTEEMYAPSSAPNTKKRNTTIGDGTFQTIIATNETMQVVMKVVMMTQTPYALPRLVVYFKVSFDEM